MVEKAATSVSPRYTRGGGHPSEETRKKISETLTGRHLSEETKRKQSEVHRGQIPWIKGKRHTKEAKRKISEAGMKRSPSKETRQKLSEMNRGENNPHFGKHPSEETLIKKKESMERFWLNNNGFRKKMSEVHKGKKHHNWRGGITPINQQIRHSFEANEWRTMVFGRDGFACQMCFRKGVYLNAHHIKPFAKYPELRFEIDNGITLCEECHNKTKWKEEEFAPMLETLVLNQKNRVEMKW